MLGKLQNSRDFFQLLFIKLRKIFSFDWKICMLGAFYSIKGSTPPVNPEALTIGKIAEVGFSVGGTTAAIFAGSTTECRFAKEYN